MCCQFSIASLVAGITVAYAATRFPAHAVLLETVAGFLLVGGLALLGIEFSPLMARP